MSDVNQTLADLGIALPDAPAPAANYVPFVQSGNLVFVSGQVSMDANGLVRGKLGENMSVEDAQKAARLCALNLLAQLAIVWFVNRKRSWRRIALEMLYVRGRSERKMRPTAAGELSFLCPILTPLLPQVRRGIHQAGHRRRSGGRGKRERRRAGYSGSIDRAGRQQGV